MPWELKSFAFISSLNSIKFCLAPCTKLLYSASDSSGTFWYSSEIPWMYFTSSGNLESAWLIMSWVSGAIWYPFASAKAWTDKVPTKNPISKIFLINFDI